MSEFLKALLSTVLDILVNSVFKPLIKKASIAIKLGKKKKEIEEKANKVADAKDKKDLIDRIDNLP